MKELNRTSKRVDMTKGDVATTLKNLTIPMIFGVLGLVAFNLADTYYISKLGTLQVAALTFTFPVVLVINSLNLGLGIGASALISRAVGANDQIRVKRLSTDALTLGGLISIVAIIIGELTIEPLFTSLGADHTTLPYIKDYMRIWYAGVPFVAVPMIGNNAIRALGDTKTPSMVMMVSAIGNIILDPLLIFGIWIFPELGVSGAATATVFSRMITFCVALYILGIREKVISFKAVKLIQVLDSWKSILLIGIPNAIARMILPIGSGIITSLIAVYGTEVVAGYGIATRLEYFSLAIIRALVSITPVFVGQNFGGGKLLRIRESISISRKFSLLYGIFLYLMLFFFARPLAYIFTDVEAVADTSVLYMRLVPLAYGFQGIILLSNGALNALNHPIQAASLNLIQLLVIYVPTALIFSKYFGLVGIFGALSLSYLLTSGLAYYLVERTYKRLMEVNYIEKNK